MWTGGVKDAMLSSIVPEVTQIRQNCQKGVMECNRERFEVRMPVTPTVAFSKQLS